MKDRKNITSFIPLQLMITMLIFATQLVLAQSVSVTVNGRSGPWDKSVNPSFPYAHDIPQLPASFSVVPGKIVLIGNASGTVYGGFGVGVGPDGYVGDPWGPQNDRMNTPGIHFPSNYAPTDDYPIWIVALMGVFADENGVVIGQPFLVGTRTLAKTVPAAAARLQLGVNDDTYADNSGSFSVEVMLAESVTVDARSGPWNPSSNSTFSYGRGDQRSPLVIEVNPGEQLFIGNATGQVQAAADFPWNGPDGYTIDPQGPINDKSYTAGIFFPSKYTPSDWPTYLVSLMGTFTDASGIIVGQPFVIGTRSILKIVPNGASRLQLGLNDDTFADNNGSFSVNIAVLSSASKAPQITQQPQNKTVLLGQTVNFSVTAFGTEPIIYQWQRNGIDLIDNGRISGATTATLTISSVESTDAGNFWVKVGNAVGVTISDVAVLNTVNSGVVAWGDNSHGQTNLPAGLTDILSIAGGGYHTLALKADGTVVAWGGNTYGQSTVPAGLTGVIGIAAGYEHSVALKGDGTVVCWGKNDASQCKVPLGLKDVIQVTAGYDFCYALKKDGTVVGWGNVLHGPPPIFGEVVAISAEWSSLLALKADGTIVIHGGYPIPPEASSDVVAVAAGSYHCLVLKKDGTVVGWGNTEVGGELLLYL